MTWQPIETAPKDETNLLGYESGEIYQFYWNKNFGRFCNKRAFKYAPNPTHWMFLPEPPKLP